MMQSNTIRLGHDLNSLRPTLHNGPGWRIGIWTQGCRRPCTSECLSPHLLDARAGLVFSVEDVVRSLQRAVRESAWPVEGVTVLGGEPTDQAAAVAAVLRPLGRAGLSTMVYTGRTLKSLQQAPDPGVAALLAATDILVDGPYLPDRYDDRLAWRGSTNQRLLCLSTRYTPGQLQAAYQRQKKGFWLQVGAGKISVSGLQSRRAAAAVEGLSRPSTSSPSPPHETSASYRGQQ